MMRCTGRLNNAATHLVQLDRLEQSLEITFAKAVVALALNKFEKDRAYHIGRKNLQQ
jgi:hypothetical protein